MSEQTLEIDGNTYISSTRAAQLVGYTKDYVGQLARGGKLESKLVGRTWYVSEDSIRKHKLAVHYTLTKPKKQRKTISRDEVRDNENTNISLGISRNGSSQLRRVQPPSYSEIAPADYGIDFESEETDLFPITHHKKNTDILVNTDIHFEPATNAGTRESTDVFHGNNVTRRQPTPARRQHIVPKTADVRRERHTQTGQVHFDGIIPTNHKEKRRIQTSADMVSTSPATENEKRGARNTRHHAQAQTRFHLFPLVTAVAIFVIIALAYFFS